MQAEEFYDTLLADPTLSFQLSKLKNTEVGLNAIGQEWEKEYHEFKKVSGKLKEYDALKEKDGFYNQRKEWLRKFEEIAKILLKDDPDKLALLFPDSEFLNK